MADPIFTVPWDPIAIGFPGIRAPVPHRGPVSFDEYMAWKNTVVTHNGNFGLTRILSPLMIATNGTTSSSPTFDAVPEVDDIGIKGNTRERVRKALEYKTGEVEVSGKNCCVSMVVEQKTVPRSNNYPCYVRSIPMIR